MYGIPTKAGQWLDNGCWDKEGFVCQTKKRMIQTWFSQTFMRVSVGLKLMISETCFLV